MGQDSIISQSFHFCCFRVLLKKKKKRTQFLKFWNTLALCPSPEVRLAFLLLHLSCPWVDSVGEGGPAFTHFQSAWRRSSVSCPRHQAQWALGDYLLPPGGLPVLSVPEGLNSIVNSQCCFLHGQAYLAGLVVWVVFTPLLFCCYFN